MENDRVHPRFEQRHVVTATVVEPPEGSEELTGRTLSCQTNDYSMGGISIPVTKELPIDTRVRVTVALRSPAHTISDIEGRVAWSRRSGENPPYAIGIEFTDMSTEQAADWKALVRAGLLSG